MTREFVALLQRSLLILTYAQDARAGGRWHTHQDKAKTSKNMHPNIWHFEKLEHNPSETSNCRTKKMEFRGFQGPRAVATCTSNPDLVRQWRASWYMVSVYGFRVCLNPTRSRNLTDGPGTWMARGRDSWCVRRDSSLPDKELHRSTGVRHWGSPLRY